MIHYHGLPITPETAAVRALQAGHGFVSFADPRNNGSNVAGAAVDSIVFPLMVYKGLDPSIVVPMFFAKVAGGAMWAWLLNKRTAGA